MGFWGWFFVVLGVMVWAAIGLAGYVLWVFKEEDKPYYRRWSGTFWVMTVVCGPAVWVSVAVLTVVCWRRRRRGNNEYQ